MLAEFSPKHLSCLCVLIHILSTRSPRPLSHPGPSLSFQDHCFCWTLIAQVLLCTQSVILGSGTAWEPVRHADSQYYLTRQGIILTMGVYSN